MTEARGPYDPIPYPGPRAMSSTPVTNADLPMIVQEKEIALPNLNEELNEKPIQLCVIF
jgi:hypothetical protein